MAELSPADVFDVLCAAQRLWPIFGEPWPYSPPSLMLLGPWREGKRVDLFGAEWSWQTEWKGRIRWTVCTFIKQFEYFDTEEEADARLVNLGWILTVAA